MVQPTWATDLIRLVALEEGRRAPKVRWIQRNRFSTTGVYYRRRKAITICVGRDGLEKQVLLHELAHHLTRGKGHTKKFWLKLGALLKRHDCLTEEFKQRELSYKRKATYAFL